MSVFNVNIVSVSDLIKERETLNAKRSAWLRAEGASVCMEKEYRLLCKAINELGNQIRKLTANSSVMF